MSGQRGVRTASALDAQKNSGSCTDSVPCPGRGKSEFARFVRSRSILQPQFSGNSPLFLGTSASEGGAADGTIISSFSIKHSYLLGLGVVREQISIGTVSALCDLFIHHSEFPVWQELPSGSDPRPP